MTALALLAGVLACEAAAEVRHINAFGKKFSPEPEKIQTGIASWYGGRFIGGKTANGERYHASDLTAAHRSLPFNTYVRVTNLRNNQSVIVRINNRGPFIQGRIIDMSVRAAEELGMKRSGLAQVRVEVLQPVGAGETSSEKMAGAENPDQGEADDLQEPPSESGPRRLSARHPAR